MKSSSSIINKLKSNVSLIVIAGLFVAIYYLFAEFSAFFAGALASVIGLKLIHIVDDKLLGDVDTFVEIVKKRNLAYAIYFASISFVVGICFLAAFLAFIK